jgi:hypothetical protein
MTRKMRMNFSTMASWSRGMSLSRTNSFEEEDEFDDLEDEDIL